MSNEKPIFATGGTFTIPTNSTEEESEGQKAAIAARRAGYVAEFTSKEEIPENSKEVFLKAHNFLNKLLQEHNVLNAIVIAVVPGEGEKIMGFEKSNMLFCGGMEPRCTYDALNQLEEMLPESMQLIRMLSKAVK